MLAFVMDLSQMWSFISRYLGITLEPKTCRLHALQVQRLNSYLTMETSCSVLWKGQRGAFPLSAFLIMTFKCWHLCMNRNHFSKDNVSKFIFFCPLNDFLVLPHLFILLLGFAILSHLRSLSQGFKVIFFKERSLGIKALSVLDHGFRAYSCRKL